MNKKTINFGIIGTGNIAHLHAIALEMASNAQCVAVADIDQKQLQAFASNHPGITLYNDHHKLLADPGVDAVSICTPSALHHQCVIDAAQAKKHVFCEKPLDIDLKSIDLMIEACEANDVKLAGVFQKRTSPVVQKIKQAIESGALGKLILVELHLKMFRGPSYYNWAEWRGTWKVDGGGVLMNQGIHGIDLMCHILGAVVSVFAKADHLSRPIEVEDTVAAVLEFQNGAFGIISASTAANPSEPIRLKIAGDRGTIVLKDPEIEQWAVSDDVDKQAEPVELEIEAETYEGETDPVRQSAIFHKRQIEDLADAIINDRQPMVDGVEARRAVEIILAVYESAKCNKEVRFNRC